MTITHVMADGTVRKSIEGVVIQSDQFYQVVNGILEKRKERGGCYQARKEAECSAM